MEISSTQKFLRNNLNKISNSKVINLGCPKNQVDAEKLCFVLKQNGITLVEPSTNFFNAVWINTCCFVDSARQETFDMISKFYHMKDVIVIVFGCFASRYKETLQKTFPEIILISSKDFVSEIQKLLSDSPFDSSFRLLSNPYSAYLKIADGCNRTCNFCIIPSIKGSFVSFPEEKILNEARHIKDSYPVQEIILIAQDTQAYGAEHLSEDINLLSLVNKIASLKLFQWIRVMYLFPSFDFKFLDELLSIPSVIPYVDIPLQHTVPHILQSMNRPSDIGKTLTILSDLRKKYQDLTIRSTFIVGYPGESDHDFEQLCSDLQHFKFDRAGFFAYSDEKDAPSYHMMNKINNNVKEQRLQRAYKLQESISLEQNRQLIDQKIAVLLEEWSPINRRLCGRTPKDAPEIDQYIAINAPSPSYARKIGSIVEAVVTKAHPYHIEGKLS